MKVCNKCKVAKSIEFFSRDGNKKDGLRTICKECSQLQKKVAYDEKTAKKRKFNLSENIEELPKYHISKNGIVFNRRTGNEIKAHLRNGYLYVGLYDDEKRCFKKMIHRLIATAYIESKEGTTQVNHIDGNKLNNNISNLEWVTPKENTNHAHRLGLINVSKGEKHHWKNKPSVRARKIMCTTKDGEVLYFDNSFEPVKRGYATQQSKVNSCCNGKRKLHCGNKWVFV